MALEEGLLLARHHHVQRSLHTQEARQIRDLGLQSRVHLGRKMIKWLHYHIQVILLLLALPCPYGKAIYQQSWVQYPPSRVNASGVLGWYHQITLLVTKQINIKTWQQANDWSMCRRFVQPCRTRLEHAG